MRVERGEVVKDGLRALEKASFPTAVEWNIWWREHNRRVADQTADGWETALGHAVGRLFDNQLTLARMIRLEGGAKQMIRYDADGQIFGEENRSAEDITREAFMWWLTQARPSLLVDGTDRAKPGVPDWARVLAKGVEGSYIQQCRLGIELTAIKKKGYLTVNASATKPLPTERALHDMGMEALSSFSDRDREEP